MSPLFVWLLLLLKLALVEPITHDFTDTVDNIENLVQYEYQYTVDEGHAAGPVMGRWEKRLGDYVKGTYTFLGPDNIVRTVDYEVDGPSGYKAVQRLNPLVPDLLSARQLHTSLKYFPHSLPNPSDAAPIPQKPENGQSPRNYHAYNPYWNLKGTLLDQKTASSTNFDPKEVTAPKSPVNYNVNIPKKAIYWTMPPGKILDPKKDLKLSLYTKYPEKFEPFYRFPNIITEAYAKPLKRDSKLVKRFNSFDEVIRL